MKRVMDANPALKKKQTLASKTQTNRISTHQCMSMTRNTFFSYSAILRTDFAVKTFRMRCMRRVTDANFKPHRIDREIAIRQRAKVSTMHTLSGV